MLDLIIIGGNAAGLTAASRARRLDPRLKITVLEKGPFISYSTCGIPYFLAKIVRADDLLSYTPDALKSERNITVHPNTRADAILPGRRRVQATCVDTGEKVEFRFDRLLIATGVRAKIPDIPGAGMGNVHTIVSHEDALRVRDALGHASSVAIVGAGYVGLEMAESLRSIGKTIRLYEQQPHVLPSVDPDMARIIEYELRRWDVDVITGARVEAVIGGGGQAGGLKARGQLGARPADLVLLDTGVIPNVDLALESGVRVGPTGAIAVNEYMETSVPSIYAAGNCAESFCLIRKRPVVHYIGTVAAKQGRIAGENMAGMRSRFNGTIGTTVLKVFELGVARTGLSSHEAAAERMEIASARIEAVDRASYYPTAKKIWVKLLVNRETRRLIGAQAVGYGEVSKRIDVAATAITAGMRIDDVAQLDLAYSPPFGSLWDPFLIAAQAVLREL